MSLRIKAPLLVLLVALFTSGLSAWSLYSSNIRLLEACRQTDMRTAAAVTQTALQEVISKAAARAALFASMPNVQFSEIDAVVRARRTSIFR